MTEEKAPYDVKVIDNRGADVPAPIEQGNSFLTIFQVAAQKNYDPAFIKELMDLQERQEAKDAKRAYVRAMAEFKRNPPEILKTKHVSYTNSKGQKVEWDHAVLGEITEAIIKEISEHGFYHRWDTVQPDKSTVVTTCIITHELGHSESTSMSGPPDTSGGKDELKAVSSTNTLLQRLTLLALTGLAAKGMDNEGNGNGAGSEPVYLSDKQLSSIIDMINDRGANEEKFLVYMGVETLETIPAKEFSKAMAALRAKKKVEAEREPGIEG